MRQMTLQTKPKPPPSTVNRSGDKKG